MRARRTVSFLFFLSSLAVSCHVQGAEPPRSEELRGYRIAPGFRVEIAASEPLVVNPVSMTWGPDGKLYVIEWKAGREPNDHIKVLSDTNGDGRFDKSEFYMKGFDLPAGLRFRDGWTYVTLDHDVVRFRDKDKDGTFEDRQVIVTGFGNDDSHHRVSGLNFGADGWLYMTTGDSDARPRGSDGSSVTVLRCGGVFRCLPDGSKLEVVAHGLRNPWGNIAFDDRFNIFHTDNDNEGSPGFTGCRILHIVEGGDYGWRLRQGARCCNPDFERATWNGGQPGRLGWITETGRGAPAGLAILNSAAFPDSKRNLLVYPDVFRKLVRAYEVEPKGATFGVKREFELIGSDDPMFRPDDAEVGPDGALYVLDWRTDSGGAGALSGDGVHGRIYRISWGGTDSEPARPLFPGNRLTQLAAAKTEVLVEALRSSDYQERQTANDELIRRGPESLEKLLAVVRDGKASEPTRLHTLSVIAATSPNAIRPLWLSIIKEEANQELVRLAYDQIARFASPNDTGLAHLCLDRARSLETSKERLASPVTRNLALAMGQFSAVSRELQVDLSRALLGIPKTLDPSDSFAIDAVTRSLTKLGATALDVVQENIGRPEALFVLRGWKEASGRNAIVSAAIGPKPLPTGVRAGLFLALREIVEEAPADSIAAWLDQSSGAEVDARVEAMRLLKARSDHATTALEPSLIRLLTDQQEKVRLEAFELAAFVRSEPIKMELIAAISNAERSMDERRLALAALRSYSDNNPRLAKSLLGMLETKLGENIPFRIELLRAIGALDFTLVVKPAENALQSPERELRQTAITILGQRPASALTVARLFNEGKLPREDLRTIIEALGNHQSAELQAALGTLIKSTLLAVQTGPEARRFRDFVRNKGNAERGKTIFFDSKKGGCASCHRLEGTGGTVGPDLTRIWDTLSFEKRVESILEPSKEIKEGYTSFKIATNDGRILTGLLLSDTAEGVTLKDAQGREVRIPANEIDQKGIEKTSLMPIGVVGTLSLNEFADLLTFLGDRKVQEGIRTQKP